VVDEELLRPSREQLANLGAEIKRQEALAVSDIERYGYGSREYARQRWAEFSMTVEPMRREMEVVTKVIADYYALQTDLPPIVIPASQLP